MRERDVLMGRYAEICAAIRLISDARPAIAYAVPPELRARMTEAFETLRDYADAVFGAAQECK